MIALLQVFHRFVLNSSLSWSEEAQIFGHIWIVFLGIPIAYRRGAHLYIETFCDMLPRGPRAAFNLADRADLGRVRRVADGARLAWSRASPTCRARPGLEVPMSYPYSGMVVGGAYLLLVARAAHRPAARGGRSQRTW